MPPTAESLSIAPRRPAARAASDAPLASPSAAGGARDGCPSSVIDLAPAPLGADESARLAALHELLILDTPHEEVYDEVVAIASEVCQTPIALVSLVDGERQWFKARVGLDADETPRDVAFCAHAIRTPTELFTVPDATRDARFASNPLVVGSPDIRFYAGMPLVTDAGHALGTLCVIDTVPRALTPGQERALTLLAKQATRALELRRQSLDATRYALDQASLASDARLKQEKGAELLELVLLGQGLGLWDLHVPSGRWTSDPREHEMLGYRPGEVSPASLTLHDVVHPDDWPAIHRSMEAHLAGRATHYECTHRMRHRDGRWLWIQTRAVVVDRASDGSPLRIVGTHLDVTERRRRDAAYEGAMSRRRVLVEQATELIFVVRKGLRLTEANASFARALGYTVDEALQLRPWDWDVQYPTKEAFLARWPTWDPHPWTQEMRWRRRDGTVFDVELSCSVLTLNGEAEMMFVCRDITTEKANRVALARAKQLLEQTAEIAQVGGWEFDPATDRLEWSKEVYRIHEADPAWQPTVDDAIHFYVPDARPVIAAAVAAALADGTSWDLELQIRTARGKLLWVRAIGRVEHGDDGSRRLVGAFQDITERRAAQAALIHSEHRLRMITDNLPAMISHVDEGERYTFVNSEFARIYRQPREALVGRTLREVRSPKAHETGAPHVAAALRGERVGFEGCSSIDGRAVHYQSFYVPDRGPDGRVAGFYELTFDVTDRKRTESRLIESERRLRGLADNLPALFAEVDADGTFRYANANYANWLGLDVDTLIGTPVRSLAPAIIGNRSVEIERALAGESVAFERDVELPIGRRTLQSTYVPHFDEHGRVAGFYALTGDITELKQTQRRLEEVARVDPLTGLANRRCFEERMPDALARSQRSGRPGALLYLDVDGFKRINDSFGHAGGDEVLKQFGARLRAVVREAELVARYAGDEFVIVIEGLQAAADAQVVAAKLIDAIRVPMTWPGRELIVTTSIGVVLFRGPENVDALLAAADAALYATKENGRDGYRLAA